MASGTISGMTNNAGIISKIEWKSVADYDSNTSTVTAKLYYKRITNYTTYGTGSFTLSIGVTEKTESKYITIKYGEWTEAITLTTTVSHESNGKGYAVISGEGGIDGTTLSSTYCSDTAVFETIPRASTIYSVSGIIIGALCTVRWYPKSNMFRYKLKFSIGSWSFTTGTIHPDKVSLHTYTYVIPLDASKQITDAKTGSMTITLFTYSDSEATTQIGEADSQSITVEVPNNSNTQPDVTLVLEPVNEGLDDDFSSLYIQGKSKVRAKTFTATGKYGATISSYSLTVLNKSYSSPYESDYLAKAGVLKVRGRVTDSRGYITDYIDYINVLPYNAPNVLPASGESTIICSRCYADGTIAGDGEYLRIIARRSYSTVTSDDTQYNFCDIRYRYRLESDKTYPEWITLLSGDDTSADTVDSGAILDVVMSTTSAYVVQIGVIDDVGGANAYQVSIPTAFATVDIPKAYKGRSIGIFRYAAEPTDDEERRVDIDGVVHGGALDNLTLGTMLTATADAPITLADTRTPGCYYSPNATNTMYITDSPYTEGGFGLEVRQLQHKDYIRQTMYYGRTTIWRHYNGSEWSDWVRVMVSTEFETACTDFVIEQGESGGWTYKKWKSKTYEMYGTFSITLTESKKGELLYQSNVITVATPFGITNDAVVTGSTPRGNCWLINEKYVDANTISVIIMSDKTISTTGSITVRLHVVGTYA